MKFEPNSHPVLPDERQLSELYDLLITTQELILIYAVLEKHPRLASGGNSQELFISCHGQLQQDVQMLQDHLHHFLTAVYHEEEWEEREGLSPWLCLPDLEKPDPRQSVYELVKKVFFHENLLATQLKVTLRSAQLRNDSKLEMQLKMIILSTEQRYVKLEGRYGFASGKSTSQTLLDGLKRQTTRILSAFSSDRKD